MTISEKFPCSDEKCTMFITDSDDPFVCIHMHKNAEAIEYWGRVARGKMNSEDVIEEYRNFLDFEKAEETTQYSEHYNDDLEWTGPTVNIEIRADNETVKTITVYPEGGFYMMGYSTAKKYAYGYADALSENSFDYE